MMEEYPEMESPCHGPPDQMGGPKDGVKRAHLMKKALEKVMGRSLGEFTVITFSGEDGGEMGLPMLMPMKGHPMDPDDEGDDDEPDTQGFSEKKRG